MRAHTATCLLTLLALASPLLAQEDHIETDRDSFTRSPRIVPETRTVVEGSYTFLEQEGEHNGHLYPDLLVRYGLQERLELRLGWTYESGKLNHLAPESAEKVEEGLMIYGAKLFVTETEGWVPDSSIIVSGYTPTSGESNDTDFSVEYALGWEWGEGWELDWGLRWFSLVEEEDHFTEWAPSVVFKGPVGSPRINAHVEYFCQLSTDREEDYQLHYFGPGAHYLITPDIEIGARVFWGLNRDAADFVCNVGMGVRF